MMTTSYMTIPNYGLQKHVSSTVCVLYWEEPSITATKWTACSFLTYHQKPLSYRPVIPSHFLDFITMVAMRIIICKCFIVRLSQKRERQSVLNLPSATQTVHTISQIILAESLMVWIFLGCRELQHYQSLLRTVVTAGKDLPQGEVESQLRKSGSLNDLLPSNFCKVN